MRIGYRYRQDEPRVRIMCGDALDQLRKLPDGHAHTCVTSPPYYGLRDYGVEGQIGLEQTPDEFISKLVAIFREVRRVLRDDGTCWINIGDSYASQGGKNDNTSKTRKRDLGHMDDVQLRKRFSDETIKPKDLIGIPWMLAFALRADGWFLRQEIIWHKPNPMPESVRDRCTKAHETVFLLSKSPRYYFDVEAIREDSQTRKLSTWEERRGHEPMRRGDPGLSGHVTSTATLASRTGRNKRSVWTITPKPYPDTHFATFPPKLVEPCILAGSPSGGVVIDPFAGSGTTGQVALQHGRNAVLIELNPDYIQLIRDRISCENSQERRCRDVRDVLG